MREWNSVDGGRAERMLSSKHLKQAEEENEIIVEGSTIAATKQILLYVKYTVVGNS